MLVTHFPRKVWICLFEQGENIALKEPIKIEVVELTKLIMFGKILNTINMHK